MNTNAYAILALLSQEPMTGYMIKQWVDKGFSQFWKMSYGQIYPTLKKFGEEGLVTVHLEGNEKGQTTKWYTITDQGMDCFRSWVDIDVHDFNIKDEAHLKFYFSGVLGPDRIIEKAQKALAYNRTRMEAYKEDMDRMKKEEPDPSLDELLHFMAVKKGEYLNQARMQWEHECIEAMKWFKDKEEKKLKKLKSSKEEGAYENF